MARINFKNLKNFISLNFRYENDFDKRSITISTNRKNIINEFLKNIVELSGDASHRKFYRDKKK